MKRTRLIPLALATVLLAACSGHGEHFDLISSGNTSIDNGAIRVSGGEVSLHPDHAASASITDKGDFLVDDKPVAVTPAQRTLLLQYYAAATAVRQHGLETGKAGAAAAGEALKDAVSSVAGDDKADEERTQAQSDKVQKSAMKICDDLARIRAVQGQLAADLHAFKPYGSLIDADTVNECRDDNDD